MSNPNYTSENYASIEAAFLENNPNYTVCYQRETDYSRLDKTGHVYLDYTGGGIYAQTQLDTHMKMLTDGVWGNPHSHNPTSQAMTDLVEQARAYVLTYLNADPDEYDVIFTPNASGALKLVGESFPFNNASRYLAIYDNHNSVNGIREFARSRGAAVTYVRTQPPELRLDPDEMKAQLNNVDSTAFNLFAFPAQSNFSGVKHDLSWVEEAQRLGWYVMLDGAAYAPTNRIDFSRCKPDFMSLSFYKIFGYPTGIGALVARKEALTKLQRPWFAGGTITVTSVQGAGWHYLIEGHAAFEDGTVNYLSIPAVEIGLRYIEKMGIDCIHDRVEALTGWLLQQMSAMQHDNGSPLIEIYGPLNTEKRGGTIAFNINDADGVRFDFRRVEMLAANAKISLRTGCFCNPGTGEIVHNLTRDDMATIFASPDALTFEELYEKITTDFNKYPSTIRISVGLASNFADVYKFMTFLESLKNKPASEINALEISERRVVDTA